MAEMGPPKSKEVIGRLQGIEANPLVGNPMELLLGLLMPLLAGEQAAANAGPTLASLLGNQTGGMNPTLAALLGIGGVGAGLGVKKLSRDAAEARKRRQQQLDEAARSQ